MFEKGVMPPHNGVTTEHVVYAIYSFSIMLFTVLLGNKNVGKRESEKGNIIHGKRGANQKKSSFH